MNFKSSNYLKIEALYAYVSVDENGNEGILGAGMPNGMFMPLVGADKDLIEKCRSIAEKIGKASKMKIKLIKLTHREDLGEI